MASSKPDPHHPHSGLLPSFSRRGMRRPSAAQRARLEGLLPKVQLNPPFSSGVFEELFDQDVEETWLEIGFGHAEHLLGQARAHGHIGLIGCEVFPGGIASALVGLEEAPALQSRVRLWTEDVRHLLPHLPKQRVQRVFILFPDPWPKKRHHKRRLIGQDFLAQLHQIIAPKGRLRIATDHPDYANWICVHMQESALWRWEARTPEDWQHAPADHITTRYQEKAEQGLSALYFFDFQPKS